MGKYVLGFKGGGIPQSEEEQQKVMAEWTAWFGSLGESVVDMGSPFGASSAISSNGSVDGSATSGLTGYSILSASSLDDALEKSKGCPILSSGGSIEVYETLEM